MSRKPLLHMAPLLIDSADSPYSSTAANSVAQPVNERQVMLLWHLGVLLLHLAARIDWTALPPKPRRRIRPLLVELQTMLESAQHDLTVKPTGTVKAGTAKAGTTKAGSAKDRETEDASEAGFTMEQPD